jgi:hypothetical protein
MPSIELRDAFGTSYRISTTNRDTLQAWFDEWLPVLYPPDGDPRLGDPMIMSVYPLDPAGTGWDWTTDSRYLGDAFTIPRDPAKALEALDRRREWIEAQKGKSWQQPPRLGRGRWPRATPPAAASSAPT